MLTSSTTRTVNVGGVGTFSRQTLRKDIEATSTRDVQDYMRQIIAEDTAQQIKLDNQPSGITVDGRQSRNLKDIRYRASVTFGVSLPSMAMRAAEYELSASIKKYTETRSGTLSNVTSNWSWYKRKGSASRGSLEEISSSSTPQLAANEYLILLPTNVPYATIVEKILFGSGRATQKISTKKGRVAAKMGYMETTVRKLKRLAIYKDFNVSNGVSKRMQVSGNLSPGVVYLIIWPKRKR